MLARLKSAVIVGVQAHLVSVEVDVSWGLPSFTVVGLPDVGVRESRDRVRSAIRNCGFEFPQHRITVNLAPADLPKTGSSFDLPIALTVLAASGHLDGATQSDLVVLGELSLDGRIHASRGVLAIAARARREGAGLLVPLANAGEAALLEGLRVCPVETLPEALEVLASGAAACRALPAVPPSVGPAGLPDLADVRGQALARRALEIAAAGGHHLLMVGPPGTGKTMLARRLPSILPPLSVEEALEAATIHSVAGLLGPLVHLSRCPPFRAPHHTISDAALVGGGTVPRPGEISLAHHGVLFLDEAAEFSRRALETLRQPLESGEICIARASRLVTFPSRFQLVAATNPCPCGHRLTPRRACRCTPGQVATYEARVSGPLRDRIDLQVLVPPVEAGAFEGADHAEASDTVGARVLEAQKRRASRSQGDPNSRLDGQRLLDACGLDRRARALLGEACARLGISARGRTRVLRVARTIADLSGEPHVAAGHVAEALQFRAAGPDASDA